MDLGLENKRVIITGSSRGIGLSIAKSLANEGCELVICGRHLGDLKNAKQEILESAGSPKVHLLELDLAIRGNSELLVHQSAELMGGLDILINNVGTNRRKAFDETTDQDWDELMEVNFRGPLEASRAAVPFLKKQAGGSIVFNASIYGREFGGKDMSLYHVTKSALISLSKSLAIELAAEAIRVNTVAPGSTWFEGGSWDKRLKNDPEMMEAFTKRELPLGRLGKASELADAVTFLVSEKASMVTGTCWNVDGGQSRSII